MDLDVITLIWLAAGLLLMLAELLLPGLVVVFLGVSAVLVGLLRWIGVVTDLPISFVVWMVLNMALVLGLRSTLRRWFPPEESKGDIDEDVAAYGAIVEVVEDCPDVGSDEAEPGRIRFQGTTWPALSASGLLKKGQRARLVYRKDLAWVVEPLAELEAPEGEKVPVPGKAETEAG